MYIPEFCGYWRYVWLEEISSQSQNHTGRMSDIFWQVFSQVLSVHLCSNKHYLNKM